MTTSAEQQKVWRSNNPDYFKEYRAKNSEKIKNYMRDNWYVKVKCPNCDVELMKQNLNRHIRKFHN